MGKCLKWAGGKKKRKNKPLDDSCKYNLLQTGALVPLFVANPQNSIQNVRPPVFFKHDLYTGGVRFSLGKGKEGLH